MVQGQVSLDLGHGLRAFYAHLQPGSVRVKTGELVKRGQVLGRLGNSGNSAGPHLHFHVVVPLPKSRLPVPSSTGKTNSRNSSIRSCCSSVWARSVLPQVCKLRPGSPRSFCSSATTSPLISFELFQVTLSRLRPHLSVPRDR